MNVIYTVLLALPIGFLVRPRATAVLTYLVVGSWVFAFQTVTVLLSWLGHDGRSAFGPFPTALPAASDSFEVFGYGAVNVLITVVGVGLVLLGHRIRSRRVERREVLALP